MIITDIPLEDIMDVHPPKMDMQTWCKEFGVSCDDGRIPVPSECRETLTHGCIELFRADEKLSGRGRMNMPDYFDGDLSNLLGCERHDWHLYHFRTRYRGPNPMHYGLFVYWCLANGCGNVIVDLPEGNIPLFGPETPIAKIDICSKGPGMHPSFNSMQNNVLYWFTDVRNTANGHDVGILEKVKYSIRGDECDRWIHPEDLTMGELMALCGNAIGYATVYSKSDIVTKGDIGCPEPIELISLTPSLWEGHRGVWNGPPRSEGKAIHSDCPVEMYCLYCSGYTDVLQEMKIAQVAAKTGYIGLCAVVDDTYSLNDG